ncbi:Cyclic nucleotide-gated ion channel 2 [Hibiscus syriacus]|uniref:Cyclic nucleotide-gated ion channel 2 n=1 Tax=Hibiscus syriacus TaxID=106335 RepID=A0A6A2ZUY5_HIBSY|nr:Cyclic nucleotide-gated ion channel 2 [Hibiscus syriacus]
MPALSNFSSRWIGRRQFQISPRDNTDHGGDNINEDTPIPDTIECYACTQVGLPIFHSTSCDQAHPSEWEACAGTSLVPIHARTCPQKNSVQASTRQPSRPFSGRRRVPTRGASGGGSPCLYMDGGLAVIVTVLRTCVDAVHLFHVWLQFRLAYVSRESLVVGCGKLVWNPRAVASHYVRSVKGFWFDAFVILPVPQAVFWLVVPKLIKEERIRDIETILLLIFLFQFLPKVYHSISLMRRMQKVTGYIFGTIWWGFGLNLIAYFIASHVAGGCWYVLTMQRIASCLRQQCARNEQCGKLSLSCGLGDSTKVSGKPLCFDVEGPFGYGIYQWALPVVSSNSVAVKILYPIFWGLMTLSTFGNILEPTSHWLEVVFCICLVLAGLLLFTLLIGNIQVFLLAVMAKKRQLQLRCRDMEWWMKRRQLPSRLRQRVRRYERQRWATLGGEDEMELIKDLPEGLRRDIKRYLCLDLIKKDWLLVGTKIMCFHEEVEEGRVMRKFCSPLSVSLKRLMDFSIVIGHVGFTRGHIKELWFLERNKAMVYGVRVQRYPFEASVVNMFFGDLDI